MLLAPVAFVKVDFEPHRQVQCTGHGHNTSLWGASSQQGVIIKASPQLQGSGGGSSTAPGSAARTAVHCPPSRPAEPRRHPVPTWRALRRFRQTMPRRSAKQAHAASCGCVHECTSGLSIRLLPRSREIAGMLLSEHGSAVTCCEGSTMHCQNKAARRCHMLASVTQTQPRPGPIAQE